jgi:hypothetical protein
MIDQLPTAVPQPAQSAISANRDRKQASAEKDDQANSFEDIVSKAGQQESRRGKGKDGEIDLRPQSEAESRRSTDNRSKTTFELSAALRGFGTSAQAQGQNTTQVQALTQAQALAQVQVLTQAQANVHAQLKITVTDIARVADGVEDTGQQAEAGLAELVDKLESAPQQAEKLADMIQQFSGDAVAKIAERVDQTGQQAEAGLAKLVEKLKDATQQAEKLADKIQQVSGDAVADAGQPLTPSDELGLLLGLTKETDAKHGKKLSDDDKVEKTDDDDEQDSHGDKLTANSDTSRVDHISAGADAKLAKDSPAADDKSSHNDVVRLVSTNGRGRSVDIDVSSVPGDTQREAAKPATTAKVDTATVLEARRYLGFTPEPNATALTTAIKADPTWTEALHAAQSSDLSTLGNTVSEVNTLKLQMNPENLGNMVATLKLKGEELTVELRVDSIEAYQQLSADHDDIVRGLQDQGFSIDKVTVQLNAADRTNAGADRDMARQGQAQRDAEAQQRDGQSNQSGRNDGQREQPRWTPFGTSADGTAGDGSSDPGRAGNLYL